MPNFITIKDLISSIDGPYISSESGDSILEKIGIDTFDIRSGEDSIVISLTLLIDEEIGFSAPGADGLGIFLGLRDGGITSIPLEVTFGDEGVALEFSSLAIAFRFPPDMLKSANEVDGSLVISETDSLYQITLSGIELGFSSFNGFTFGTESAPLTISMPPFLIGDTGLGFAAEGVQLHFNEATTPPTGRPAGFKGLYVESARLYLPEDFVLGDVIISVSQAGVGNGGIFGTVALTWDNTLREEVEEGESHVEGAATGTFLDVPFALKQVALTLDQNVPVEASLRAELLLPFFNKAVTISISIETDGDFSFTLGAASSSSSRNLIQLDIPELLQIEVESFTGEKKDDKGIFSIKGKIKPLLGGIDWPSFDVNKLSVDTDGNVEFDGGWVNIPESMTLDFNAFKIGISQFGFGTEGEVPAEQRQWIGLSGELNLVEGLDLKASVEGLKFSWLKEPKPDGDRELAVSLTGVGVEFEIPNTLRFEGSVSYKKFDTPDPQTGLTGDLFKGNIKLNLMAVRLEIEAELMIGKLKDADGNEFTTFFIVLGAELPSGIPLGATGTSLYGIKGLAAINAGPTKTEEQNWYEWYMSAPERNITSVRKWMPIYDNYGFGAGVTIGTMFDDGFTINMSVMLVVLIPGPVIILEGKANLLKQRSDDKDEEGAFYLLAVLDGRAGTFMLNIDVRYSLEDVITVGAGLEAFFDFNDSENWYVYIGRKEPESKRIRAEILSLFKATAYFMIDSKSLQTGASVGLDIKEEYGPLSFSLIAKIAFDATIFWKPLQLEGSLEMVAELGLKIFGIGIELYLRMLLEGKVPEPYRIYGLAEMGIKLFWPLPDLSLKVEFEWVQPGDIEPVWPLLKECSFIHHKGNGATWTMTLLEEDAEVPAWDDFVVVPVDSRPVLTFARPVHNLKRHESGGERFPLLSLLHDDVGGKRFEYKLGDEELELQSYEEESWVTVKRGINSGRDDEFSISKENILNLQENTEPNEPQIQLWRYHAMDTADQYRREDYNDHHPACDPGFQQHWMTVNWQSVAEQTRYDHSFNYCGLEFVADDRVGRSSPIVTANHYLFTTGASIHFSEPVYQVVVYLNQESSTTRGFVSFEGNHVADMVLSRGFLIYRGTREIDSIRIDGRSLFIVQISYMTQESVIDQLSERNDRHEHVTEQNFNGELFLKPSTFYRLKVNTSVDVDDRTGVRESTNYVYFRTDDGPGISSVSSTESEIELTHSGKAINELSTYIERTLPVDGALNFYHGYDVGVQFNEAYVEEMFQNDIQIRFKDRNGRTLDEPTGDFIDGFLPLMHLGLLSWLGEKEEGECTGSDQPETAAPYLNFSSGLPFKPNSLYRAEMFTQTSLGEQDLHQFQFTTSRYASFTEHILDNYEDERIPAIVVPAIPRPRNVSIAEVKSVQLDVISKESDFISAEGALNKYRLIQEIQDLNSVRTEFSNYTFNELDAIANTSFAQVNMEDRPLPESFEVFRIPILDEEACLLLMESSEPIQWERITVSAKGRTAGLTPKQVGFIWNEDQTRCFMFHRDGVFFTNTEIEFEWTFDGNARPTSGVLMQGGSVVNEEVTFWLT